jgi:hypothetical protein
MLPSTRHADDTLDQLDDWRAFEKRAARRDLAQMGA